MSKYFCLEDTNTMDWKVFFASFGTVFLAELGDKTQLAGLNLAAKSKMPFVVFLGSIAAYALITLITVMIGDTLTKFIKPEYIRYGAASLFIIIGMLILFNKM
jgi:putative Ca2+/H+ antiporter (TMEM165/GDT1 family)